MRKASSVIEGRNKIPLNPMMLAVVEVHGTYKLLSYPIQKQLTVPTYGGRSRPVNLLGSYLSEVLYEYGAYRYYYDG